MTQQSGNSFSAFKTSHDLKIIESSVPIQSCQTACSDLDPGLLSGPAGSRSFSQHRGEQWLLRGRRLPPRPPAPHHWPRQCSALRLGQQQEAADPRVLAAAVTEKHPSSRGSQEKWLELQAPVLLCSHSQK